MDITSNSFRQTYRAVIAILAIAILSLMFFTTAKSNAADVITCGDELSSGSATFTFTQDQAEMGSIWILVNVKSSPTYIEANLNGNASSKDSFDAPLEKPSSINDPANPIKLWRQFHKTDFSFVKGTNTVIIKSFQDQFTLYKVAIVTDGQTPTGDGTNVLPIQTDTTSSTTSTTTSTSTSTSTSTIPGTPTTKIVIDPTSSTTTSFIPATIATTAPGITVLGTSVQNATTATSDSTLPFTGSSSRNLLIIGLSVMLAGLVALGISKKILVNNN